MAFSRDQFRADFPEFADSSQYPDSSVDGAIALSAYFVNVARWEDLTDYAIKLITAHQLVVGATNLAQSANGGRAGAVSGVLTSKSVGDVSASYDTGSVLITDAGFWNTSSYGVRFLQLSRLMGAGAIQL
jgi:hypothetical protein